MVLIRKNADASDEAEELAGVGQVRAQRTAEAYRVDVLATWRPLAPAGWREARGPTAAFTLLPEPRGSGCSPRSLRNARRSQLQTE